MQLTKGQPSVSPSSQSRLAWIVSYTCFDLRILVVSCSAILVSPADTPNGKPFLRLHKGRLHFSLCLPVRLYILFTMRGLNVFSKGSHSRLALTNRSLFSTSRAMSVQQKKASIVVVGIPWDDDRLAGMRGGIPPGKLKEGIEMIEKLFEDNGFVRRRIVQYGFLSGLCPFTTGFGSQHTL